MGKYVDDAVARRALETAAHHAGESGRPVPFTWSGASWSTPEGEWRDLPLIRRGMGEWLTHLADYYRYLNQDALSLAEEKEDLREQVRTLRRAADRATDAEAGVRLLGQAARLSAEARAITVPPLPVALGDMNALRAVSGELLSASDARATHLLSLASQFDEFRAPLRDPAVWVSRLLSAPRSAHARSSAVWDAFCAAEPVLSDALGKRTGKRLLFAAMDRRFGRRRRLAGYEGWRGVVLPS